MRRTKLTKEERKLSILKQKQRVPEPQDDRPASKEELEALVKHFGTNKNLPK